MSFDRESVVALRQRFGVDVACFAAITGVNERTVHRWEQGKTKPDGAAERVMLALREKLDGDPENAPRVIDLVVRSAEFGGLSYLLLKLLDGWSARSMLQPM